MAKDASNVLSEAQTRYKRVEQYLRDTAEWFHSREGELLDRDEAREKLADHLDMDEDTAEDAITELVVDAVDPVIQIPHGETRYVGVVEYHEYDGAYGYLHYDDRLGKRRRVVCQQCVNEAERDTDVAHATEQSQETGSETYRTEMGYEDLLYLVHQHYEEVHDTRPENTETGAILTSGTTIAGSTAYHNGNLSPVEDPMQANLDANGHDVQNVGNFDAQSVNTADSLTLPIYSTLSDVPTNLDEGTLVWIADENTIYKETGT